MIPVLEVFDSIGSDVTFEGFNTQLKALRSQYPHDTLLVKINSEGGGLKDGLAIANSVELDGNVDTLNLGLAGSVAALILLKGRKRFSASSSVTMFHKSFFEESNQNTPDNQIVLDTYNSEIINLLVAKTKLGNADAVDSLLNGMGLWLNSGEALKAGVIDQVLHSENALPDAKNRIEKLMQKCNASVLNKIPFLEVAEMPITPEELKALSDSVKNGIQEGNKPLLEEIGQLKTQLADLIKNQSEAVPVDVAAVVKTALDDLVTPVLNESKAAMESLKASNESLTGVMNALKEMPQPRNHGGTVWGAVGDKPENERFAV